MTQEEKELIHKDLCGRLPYHPVISGKSGYARDKGKLTVVSTSGVIIMTNGGSLVSYFLDEIKPYLRPMPSMTAEEKVEYDQIRYDPWHSHYDEQISFKMIDWLNEHHFDYQGLIEKGLALEAPEDIY